MFSESEWIYERQKLYALRREHPDWSLRSYARELHHDLRWVRKWVTRFQGWVEPQLEMFRSQSRKPKSSPKQLGQAVKDQICALRENLSERFHRSAGAKTIQYFLKQAGRWIPSASSIVKTLHERAYIPLRHPIEHVPLELPAPMEEWEMDFGEIYLGEAEGSLEFFLVVDRGSSRVVYLEGSSGYRAESALESVLRLFEQHGLPKRLRYDRDPRLWGSWNRDSYPSPLTRLLRVLGVEPVICPPHRPDRKPFVERGIGTLKYEWLARHSPTTLADALALLEPFVAYHNTERPHQGAACHNQIPDIAFPKMTLPILPSLPEWVSPNRWLEAEHGRTFRRHVHASGAIQIDRHSYYIGQAFAGLTVLAHLDSSKARFIVSLNGKTLRILPLKGIHPETLSLPDYLELIQAEARSIEQFRHLSWEKPSDLL